MKYYPRFLLLLISMLIILSACLGEADTVEMIKPTPDGLNPIVPAEPRPLYLDPDQPVSSRVDDLLNRMTLEEKIGQMTQVEKDSIAQGDITTYFIGSILSGGGGSPDDNTVEGWQEMTTAFQEEALATRLGIPLIYGVDAVHGHGNLYGTTIFPHQIGLGATGDEELVRLIGQATAEEILASGVHWNFAPVLAVPLDIRWGRTYESFGQDTELVSLLGKAYLDGLQAVPDSYQAAPGQTLFSLATPKHFIGDGGTVYGSSTESTYLLDQGDMDLDEATVRELFLPPYRTAIDGGARSIMASYNSWHGLKMHANHDWLTGVLKDELGFPGFVVSDWAALNQIDFNYYNAVVTGINAGIDMNMVPTAYTTFINTMLKAVDSGDISPVRVDDAVSRILRVKFELGLFDMPYGDPKLSAQVGSVAHRQLAREAVRKSAVLLKNDGGALPINKETSLIYVAGQGANDIGLQSGGWTITWQGTSGDIQPGTTILEGIRSIVSTDTEVIYVKDGEFDGMADIALVIAGEYPYAEGVGDRSELVMSVSDVELIQKVRRHSQQLVVIILSGRPLIINEVLDTADAWVAAWLPGSEGQGIADVLFGDYPFTGTLPVAWPRSMDQVPVAVENQTLLTCQEFLFPLGFGLDTSGTQLLDPAGCE